jgi:uncharacterized lipoprotein YddW (UPF0748 family)
MNPRWIVLVGLIAAWGMAGGLEAQTAEVVLVKGSLPPDHDPQEAATVDRAYGDTAALLREAGIPFAESDDARASEGPWRGYKLAILPYNPSLSGAAVRAIQDFVMEGGKLMVFYSLPPGLASLLGIKQSQHQTSQYPGQFAAIRFNSDKVVGLPPVVQQKSEEILAVQPDGETTVLGEWYDAQGQPTGYPAWTLNEAGAFMSQVLLPTDRETKRLMLVALVAHFVPSVWPQSAEQALANLGRVGEFTTLSELIRAVHRQRRGNPHRQDISFHLRAAEYAQALAESRLREGRYAEAIRAAQAGRESAAFAYILAQPPRPNELRGVWIPTAYGVEAENWNWQRSILELKRNGFNAIFPQMQWAGLAHHKSVFLDQDKRVQERGDPLFQCVLWSHYYGIECHLWKVSYNLAHTPPERLQELRAQGRTQVSVEGKPLDWLCPSHPSNIWLESQSLWEVVRRYKVDGIHLDLRYPDQTACYCEGCRDRFMAATFRQVQNWPADVLEGGPAYEDFQEWRRHQITKLVALVSRRARQINPRLKISATVLGDWESARRCGQDWKRWIEKGYLDFVCPMDDTPDEAELGRWVAQQVRWVDGRVPLYIGLGAWRLGDTPAVAAQIKRSRALGADGFVLFHYNDSEIATVRLPQLHYRQTSDRVTAPHNAPLVEFDLAPGLPGHPPNTYRAGTALAFEVRLRPKDTAGRELAFAQGEVSLQTLDGRTVQRLGSVSCYSRSRQRMTTEPLPVGTYRLVWDGWARSEGRPSDPTIARGPVITVISKRSLQPSLKATGAGS